jgi:tetratricopeptide (TPR) repeat protein
MKIMLSCLAIFTSLMLSACASPDRAAGKIDLSRDLIKQGVELRKQGKYEEAIQIFTEGLNANPRYVPLYMQRGYTYRMAKKVDLAISDYSQALLISPKVPGAYLARGVAYGAKGSYSDAVKDLSQVIAMQPRSYPAYFFRGITYYHKGQFKEAISDFNQAITLKPDDFKSYFQKGMAAERLGQPGVALACYKTFLRYVPPQETTKIQTANQKIAALSSRLDKPAEQIAPTPPALEKQRAMETPEEPEEEPAEEPAEEPVQKTRKPVKKKLKKPAIERTEVRKPVEQAERLDQKELFSAPLGEEAF